MVISYLLFADGTLIFCDVNPTQSYVSIGSLLNVDELAK